MSFDVTLTSISNTLDQLEKVKPEAQGASVNALHGLQKQFTTLLEAMSRCSDIQTKELLAAQLTLNRISQLDDHLNAVSVKTKEMLKNIQA